MKSEALRNRIFRMDCFALMEQMPEESVDMILTDPPYGVSYRNGFTRRPYPVLSGDKGMDYARLAGESYRILKKNAHAYFFTRFDRYPFHYECLKKAGFCIKNCLIIEKTTIGGLGDVKGSYANNAEWLLFCQKGRRDFEQTKLLENKKTGAAPGIGRKPVNPYKRRFNAAWFGSEYPKATCSAGWKERNGILHPTVKNVKCLEWLIQISSKPGELVFDGFMGSGSTALAAQNTGRDFAGAEIEEEYFQMCGRRLKTGR